MKKGLVLAFIACLFAAPLALPARAEPPSDELQILEQKDISALTDEKLIDSYIDVLVEMDAVKTFHATSGFMPKEYQAYKGLLKYHLLLLFEIHRRKLELPPTVN
ncbi:MAG: hypothetical protein HQL18_00695 [Candidatus Omnitrophica bacterium]|nr:hypothetical protein [Candidatus Omnitrophota bacterium]